MTKADIIENVYEKVGGFSKKEAAEIVETVFDTIKETLERGEKIKISGFGNFVVRDKNARVGRNPQTGEEITISARRVLTFKPSQVLKKLSTPDVARLGDGHPRQAVLQDRRGGGDRRRRAVRAALLGDRVQVDPAREDALESAAVSPARRRDGADHQAPAVRRGLPHRRRQAAAARAGARGAAGGGDQAGGQAARGARASWRRSSTKTRRRDRDSRVSLGAWRSLVSAPVWGTGCRRFKSSRPD